MALSYTSRYLASTREGKGGGEGKEETGGKGRKGEGHSGKLSVVTLLVEAFGYLKKSHRYSYAPRPKLNYDPVGVAGSLYSQKQSSL